MSTHRFVTTAELRARGWSIERIRAEIDRGSLERVIKGWYAYPGADRQAVRAMRIGGRLGCISALRVAGAWHPPEEKPHLLMPSHASGRRLVARGREGESVVHWHGKDSASVSAFPIAPLPVAVAQMLECQPPHLAVAVLDSLAHRSVMHPNAVLAMIADGPVGRRFLAQHFEPRSEEGIESLVRYALRSAGIECQVQAALVERHRVDLLVDGWLVVEADGRESHALKEAFTRDSVRSALLMRDGRIVLRFAYDTIVKDIEFVVATVRSVMAQHAPIR